MGALGILGSLAGGYVEQANMHQRQQFEDAERQRQLQLGLVQTLVENPNVPAEYKGALVQHGLEVVNTPYGKKLPSLDKMIQGLPAVHGSQLQNPSGPPPQAPAITLPSAPPTSGPKDAAGQPQGTVATQGLPSATQAPVTQAPTLPATPIAMPAPPPALEYAPAGQFHMLTPQEQMQNQTTLAVNHAHQLMAAGTPQAQAYQLSGLTPPPHYLTVPEGAGVINANTGEMVSGTGTLGEKADQYNSMMQNRWQIMHPGQPLPDVYKLSPDSTVRDYQRTQASLNQEEAAYKSKEEFNQRRADRIAQLQIANGMRMDARIDKSYQFNTKELDTMQTPIDGLAQRVSRLQDTLAQGNMQADALVAPELLSIMSGGQGSGLRMNEAEIARIVGGRTHWENLKAAMQKWSTDPNAARSITPDQAQQVGKLVDAVQKNLTAKLGLINTARGLLADSDDIQSHRQIVQKTKAGLAKIDMGNYQAPSGGSGPKVGDVEDGYKFNGGDPADPNNWSKAGGK